MRLQSADLISVFRSNRNRQYLFNRINGTFDDYRVYAYLSHNLDASIMHFSQLMEQELQISDPLPGVTTTCQLNCFNDQFVNDRIKFITSHILCEQPTKYEVNDEHRVSHKSSYPQTADETLQSWYNNSARGIQLREDEAGSRGYGNTYNCNRGAGIVFCDQQDFGLNIHVDRYENTTYKQILNNSGTHENTVFGISTPSSDGRLLSRRIFRRNEHGVENGIPLYETRLYRRNIERDIDEGLRTSERGFVNRGYDMSSIHQKINHKNNIRNHTSPPYHGMRPTMNLRDTRYL